MDLVSVRPIASSSLSRVHVANCGGFAEAGTPTAADSPGPFSPTFQPPGPDAAFAKMRGPGHMATPSYGANDYMSPGFIGARDGPRLFTRDIFGERVDTQAGIPGAFAANGAGLAFQQQSVGQMNQFAALQQQQQVQGQQQPIPFAAQPQPQPQQPDAHSVSSIPESQSVGTPVEVRSQQPFASPSQTIWPQDPIGRRPGPFEPDFPTMRNTVAHPHRVVAPAQPIQLPQQQQPRPAAAPTSPIATQNGQNAWGYQASQGIVSDAWGTSSDTTSLTAANLGQHNRLQEQEERQHKVQKVQQPIVIPESPLPVDAVPAHVEPVAQQPEASPVQVHAIPEVQPPVQKPRRKPSGPAAVTPSVPISIPAPAAATKASAVSASPIVSSAPKPPSPTHGAEHNKPAWSIDDAHNGKPSGAPLGLREIQEMEAKKQEARKAAERERERTRAATTAHSPSLAQEEQTTMTWGLPTSQVGARPAPGVHVKETVPLASPPSATSPAAPVWTGVAKAGVVKKTMKEIQEEEERRKKVTIKDKESVASTARRGYADTTTKVRVVNIGTLRHSIIGSCHESSGLTFHSSHVQANAPQTGGAWTTVGAGGKTSAATAAAAAASAALPARPTLATVASSKSVPTVSATAVPTTTARNGNTTPSIRPPAVPAAIKLATTPKDDAPTAPSHDFVKWMAESLKGLNTSVNRESSSPSCIQVTTLTRAISGRDHFHAALVPARPGSVHTRAYLRPHLREQHHARRTAVCVRVCYSPQGRCQVLCRDRQCRGEQIVTQHRGCCKGATEACRQ